METKTILCLNCGNTFVGNYCNQCGQKYTVARITWKELFHNVPHMLFHLDDGFFYTIKQLVVKPGQTIREYLGGKRKYHYNPFVMLLLLAGLCSTLYVYFHLQTILAAVSLKQLEEENAFIAHKFFAARTIIFCLICSVGDYFFFYKFKYNLAEMVAANVMMFCGVTIIQLAFIPLVLLGRSFGSGFFVQVIFILLVLIYMFIARYQFFKVGRNSSEAIKIALAVITYLAIFLLIAQLIVKPFLENQFH